MRPILLVFALLLTSSAFCQEKISRYTISGYLTNLKGRTVYLIDESQEANAHFDPNFRRVDSLVSNDGHFTLQGVLREANQYSLAIKGGKQSKHFILDNTPLTVIGDADSMWHASVVGSQTLRDEELLQNLLKSPMNQHVELLKLRVKALQNNDKDTDWLYAKKIESLTRETAELKWNFINSHLKSLVSLFEFSSIAMTLPRAEAQALWTRLDYPLQRHSVGKRIHDQVFERSTEPGQQTPNLILSDKENKPVSLLSYKGNVLLIDFWASWCDQCRQEHIRLKSIYDQYREGGLEIISISIDDDPKAWKKALQKAGLPWTQLTDRVGSKNVVGGQYGTNSIPINLLIDKEGNIIRKGLHGSDLARQLALVFNKP